MAGDISFTAALQKAADARCIELGRVGAIPLAARVEAPVVHFDG